MRPNSAPECVTILANMPNDALVYYQDIMQRFMQRGLLQPEALKRVFSMTVQKWPDDYMMATAGFQANATIVARGDLEMAKKA